MKVLYDAQIFRQQRFGGISRYFSELAARASNCRGITAAICAPTTSNAYLENLPRNIRFSPSFYAVKNNYIRRALNIASEECFNLIFRPDIIHETYYSKKPGGRSSALRVLTVYDMIHERLPKLFGATDQTSNNKIAAAHRADHIICISNATQTDFLEISGIDKSRTSVIHLGFGLQNIASNFSDDARTNVCKSKPYILYVGNRNGYKNFATLATALAASRILKDHHLVCFGGGGFTVIEKDFLRRLGLDGDRVRQVKGDDLLLSRHYQEASCLVYPSLYEGFGIPPLEAMAYGCPVACSNTSSIPEVVGDAGVYFDPTDPDSMQAAIESIMNSNSLTEALIQKGKNRIRSFSWDRCAQETFALYGRIHENCK